MVNLFAESSHTAATLGPVPGKTSKGSEMVEVSPGAVAIRVNISPPLLTFKSKYSATPSTTVMDLIPSRTPAPGLLRRSTSIWVVLSVVTVFPLTS